MCVYSIEAECEEVQHIRQQAVMISTEELLQLGMLNYSLSFILKIKALINEYNLNRRTRPTLKPSTSIVSKASEFVDVYKYAPAR